MDVLLPPRDTQSTLAPWCQIHLRWRLYFLASQFLLLPGPSKFRPEKHDQITGVHISDHKHFSQIPPTQPTLTPINMIRTGGAQLDTRRVYVGGRAGEGGHPLHQPPCSVSCQPGGGALTWVVLTREEAGGRNRASCHAFQSASGWQVKSASWMPQAGPWNANIWTETSRSVQNMI